MHNHWGESISRPQEVAIPSALYELDHSIFNFLLIINSNLLPAVLSNEGL